MPKYSGKDFAVKRGNADGPPETFTTIAAMRSKSMSLNDETVDVTTSDDMPWRRLLGGASGVKSMSISLQGMLTDSATHENLKTDFFNSVISNYELVNGLGEKFAGSFQVASIEESGEYNGAQQISITLESAGVITYTAVA